MHPILLAVVLGSICCTLNAAPIPMRMVDLTHVFDNTTLYWPTSKKFQLNVLQNGTETIKGESFWFQLEEYNSSIHVGTHMDAPCHFAKGMWSVDQIPLSNLIAPVAVIDIEQKAQLVSDYVVTIEDLTQWERETGQLLNDVILLMRTGWSKRWPDRENFTGTPELDVENLHFPGMSAEAAQWLVDKRNIYGLGTETLSIDAGNAKTFPAHRILYSNNIYGLENVDSMEDLPLYGATLYVMPMKIGSASGAATRIVATFPDMVFPQKSTRSVTERSLREVIIFS